MEMRSGLRAFPYLLLFFSLLLPRGGLAQEGRDSSSAHKGLELVSAVMCEGIKDQVPQNPAVVFSTGLGAVYCFTTFDKVAEETVVYHKWFHRDELSTVIKLGIRPPRWSTFSRIQLREADKGPWRVEITDQEDHVLDVLRFSITD
jgi:hypothetical protein